MTSAEENIADVCQVLHVTLSTILKNHDLLGNRLELYSQWYMKDYANNVVDTRRQQIKLRNPSLKSPDIEKN